VRGRVAVALWFLLLGALVVLVATWVAGTVAARQEREAVDTRLAASLRTSREGLAAAVADAEARANEVAATPAVQRALAEDDRAAARRIVAREGDDVAILAPDGTPLAGGGDWAAQREVGVSGPGGQELGSVVAGIPVDEELAARLGRAAGLVEDDAIALVEGTEIAAAEPPLEGEIPDEESGSADFAGDAYRFVSTPLLQGTDLRLAALAPNDPIEQAAADTRRRAFLVALAAVVGLGLLAWAVTALLRRRSPEPPPEAEPRRRAGDERERGERMREAVALVGEALAATHDPEALLPVILQSAIEATGAAGARLVSSGREVAQAGDPERGGSPFGVRLGEEEDGLGLLLLYPQPGEHFDEDARELAHWLAAQASIALENELLHRTVKRQAITDELTQLANRRRFTETLALEVRRAERFADPLTLVLADLDDFKAINDRYGHGVGDEVLRLFAEVLRENVRDFDLPVRYGGEEFAVLLPETGLDGGERLARRLQAALSRLRMPEIHGDRAPVTASFGVAAYPAGRTADELLAQADQALYRAKAEGKNRVVCAESTSPRPS
jgi:two-component system, cell cycle response regulator